MMELKAALVVTVVRFVVRHYLWQTVMMVLTAYSVQVILVFVTQKEVLRLVQH